MKSPSAYPVLETARDATMQELPLGVPLGDCDLCRTRITDAADRLVYQRTKDGPALVVHQRCAVNDLQRAIKLLARPGGGRAFGALRS